MTHPTARLLVLSAGLSTPSSTRMLADQLAASSREALEATGYDVEIRTLELRELAHDVLDSMLSRFPVGRMVEAVRLLSEADAVIAVTPIFNTTASGLFKTFLDAADMQLWKGTPVLLGATAGTARHSLALEYAIRPMFVHLKADIVPTAVFAASADFGGASASEGAEALGARSRRAGTELATMLRARTGPTAATSPSAADAERPEGAQEAESDRSGPAISRSTDLDAEFTDFVPMGQLLRR